jgi:hypothetical protein
MLVFHRLTRQCPVSYRQLKHIPQLTRQQTVTNFSPDTESLPPVNPFIPPAADVGIGTDDP